MHHNHPGVSGMLYFFALNKSKIIPVYYGSPIIEIDISPVDAMCWKEISNEKLALKKTLFFTIPLIR